MALCACGVASASEGNIVQAKRAQTATEAARGSNPPPPRSSAPGARPALKRSYPAPHAHAGCAKQRRLQDDRVRCRRFTAEPNEGGSANSSRRLSPLSALLTVKLRGRPEAPQGAEGAQFPRARGAQPQARHGPLQRLLGGKLAPVPPCPAASTARHTRGYFCAAACAVTASATRCASACDGRGKSAPPRQWMASMLRAASSRVRPR